MKNDNQMNSFLHKFKGDQFNTMKIGEQSTKNNNMNNLMAMSNMMNNQMNINNMANNQINVNNMMNNQMNINNMMNYPMEMNMTNNQMNINNMMNNLVDMNNMMNNPMEKNNITNNQMNINNMMNNLMIMNNMMNNLIKTNNMMSNPMQIQMNEMMSNLMKMNDFMNMPNIFDNQNKKNEEKEKKHKQKYNPCIKRKIPSILEKNANKKIESITFKVEKDLKPTNDLYKNQNIKQIFNKLFKNIDNDMPMEILHYKFDTNEKEIYNFDKKSLIQGLVIAYKNHFPITVTPDMIWLLILQGYSRFMDKYSELVKEKYVNFSGQKTLYINRYGEGIRNLSDEGWNGIIDEVVEQIGEHVGEETISNLQSDFTTTNAATLIASQATIMSAMKHYFKYEVLGGGCGISYITLEGSLEDWEKIKSKLEYLTNFALKWWTKELIPIINNIIETKKYLKKNKSINDDQVQFWKTMIRIKGKGDIYDPHILNGWIIKFIPNLDDVNHPKLYEELKETEVPDQIISCPLKIIEVSPLGYKIIYNCDIASGFFGMIQNKKNLTVRPVIGCAIVIEKKESSPLTLEDKNEIINNYFN